MACAVPIGIEGAWKRQNYNYQTHEKLPAFGLSQGRSSVKHQRLGFYHTLSYHRGVPCEASKLQKPHEPDPTAPIGVSVYSLPPMPQNTTG